MVYAIIIAALVGLGGGGAGGYALATRKADREAAQERSEHAAQVQAREEELRALTGDLERCQAEVAPKSLDAAGRVLEASQATDVADLELRAAVVSAIPATTYAEAVIETGSPRSIAAAEALAGCRAANTQGDSARSGCATVIPQAWAAAVEALEACPVEAP